MADDLSIILSAKIGTTATDIDKLNNQIKGLSNKLQGFTIDIKINDNITQTLNNFTKAFNDIQKQAQNVGKVIEKSVLPDGTSITRTYFNGIKGEFSELVQQAQRAQKENEQLRVSLDELQQGYDNLTKSATRYNAQQKEIGSTIMATDNAGTTRRITTNTNGDVSGYTDTYNAQAVDKYNSAVSNLKNNINSLEQRMTDLGISGQHVSDQFNALSQAFNKEETSATKNINDVKSLTDQYKLLEQEISRVESLGVLRSSIDPASLSSSSGTQTQVLRNYITQAYAAEGATANLEHTQVTLNQAFDSNGNAIQRYTVQFRDSENQIRQYQGTFDQLTSGLYQSGERITQAGTELTGFNRVIADFGHQMMMMPVWMASWTAITAPIAALHSIASTIVDVDTQMTQLKRVMSNNTDFNGMLQQSITMSNELGSKLNDVLQVETEFARQGFNESDVLNLTRVTSLLTNIGDVTPTQAMTLLTTAMKNFNITASDSITIADKLNNVSNNYSVDTATLADSLTKAAASAKTYGVSLNDLVGMTTAISETTKESGDVIGNSLKTIFSRLDSNASVKALQAVGVTVQDTSGRMKTATQVMSELANKWDGLTSAQQQQTAVAVAGRYQLTRFLALMQDWGTVVRASSTALNSQNSAMKENQTYQASMQAQINRLQTAWKTLSLAIGNEVVSKGLIAVVGGLTSLTKDITPLTNSIGLIPTVLATASIALTAFKANAASTVGDLGKLGMAFKLFGVEAEASMTVFKTAIASTGVGLAVLLGSMGIEALLNQMGKAQAARSKEQDQINTLTQTYQSNGTQIKNYADQYVQLSKAVTDSNGKVDKSSSNYQSYLDVQNKLAKLMPSLVSYTDADGQAHLKSASEINTEIQSVQTLTQAKKDLNAIQIKDDIAKYAKDLQQATKDLQNAKDQYNFDKTGAYSPGHTATYYDTISAPQTVSQKQQAQDYLDLANAQYQLQVLQKQSVSYSQQQAQAYLDASKAGKSLTSTDKNLVDAFIEQNKNQINTKGSANDLTKSIDELSTKAADYGKIIVSIQNSLGKNTNLNFLSGNSPEQLTALSNLISAYKSGNMTLDEFTKRLDSLGLSSSEDAKILDILTNAQNSNTKSQTNSVNATNSAANAQKNLQAILKSTSATEDYIAKQTTGNTNTELAQQAQLIEIYTTLSNVKNKNTEQSAMYVEVLKQLQAQFPGLVQGHKADVMAIQNEIDANQILNEAAIKVANGTMTAEEAATYAKVKATNERINAMKNEIAALQTMQEAYNRAANQVGTILSNMDKGMGMASGDLAKWTTIAMQTRNLMGSAGYANLSGYESELSSLESQNLGNISSLGRQMNTNVSFKTPTFDWAGTSSGGSSGSKGSKGGSGSSSSANSAQQAAQNLANSIVQIYKDMYQKEEDIAVASIQKQMDALDAQHQKVLDNLSAEEKAYQDSVNKKLALIDKQSNAQQYSETLKKQQQTVQNDQNLVNVLSLDNSPEGKAKLAAAQQQLASDQKTLNDTISQHTTDMRKQNLQDDLTAYQQDIQNQQDAETKKYNDKKAALQKQQDQVKSYYDNLINDQRKFNKITSDVLKGNFSSIKKDFSSFADFIKKNMKDIGQSISENLLDNMTNAEKSMHSSSGKHSSSSGSHKSPSGGHHSSSSSSHSKYYTVQSGDTLSKIAEREYGHGTYSYYDKIAKANGISVDSILRIGERLKIPSLAVGGVVSVPTLIQAGDAGQGNPEIFAPKKLMMGLIHDGLTATLKQFALNQADKIKNLGNTINMPITIQSLNGTKQGAMEFFNIVQNELNKVGVNN